MRVLPGTLLLSIALGLAVLSAAAQSPQDSDGPPGCVEANPCDLIIAVDEQGFADVSETEFTEGDWLLATIVNHDEANHTIKLASHDLEFTVAGGDLGDADPFRINGPGTYTLSDEPTGDTVQITSVEADEFEDDADEDSNGTPGLGPVLVLASLVAGAAFIRRRD